MEKIEKHITIQSDNQTSIDCLASSFPNISKQKLKLAMKYGCVWLTTKNRKASRLRKAKKSLNIGDKLSIYYDEAILFNDIPPAKLISDNDEYSVWDKPSGMFSQGSKWGDHTSITRWVELFGFKKYGLREKPAFLVHRLDRATNGVILIAHSKNSTVKLTRLFENREIEKQYEAVVKGEFPNELIMKNITTAIDGKHAVSRVLSSEYHSPNDQSRLIVKIETGRKHQIRIHLASVGFPIIGDRLYGRVANETEYNYYGTDLMLQSKKISFICPMTNIKQEFSIE